MSRILYVTLPQATVTGGVKISFRHVEALRALGFDAAVALRPGRTPPAWFEHGAPIVDIEGPDGPRADDVLVLPEDSYANLVDLAGHPARKWVFCQNHFYSCRGVTRLTAAERAGYQGFIACSRTVADWLAWRFPGAPVSVIPAFVDEGVYRPAPEKRAAIAYAPRKRRSEALYLEDAFRWAHPRHADLPWVSIDELPEAEVGRILGESALFLSLSHLEGLGLMPLEAMAAGCLVAGFTGYGGREYATAENGFWAEETDAVADALAAAADRLAAGGPALATIREACRRTAERYSRMAMVEALEAFFAAQVARGG